MNGPDTQTHAEGLISASMMEAAELRTQLLAKPLSRLLLAVGSAIREAVLRVVWHLGDVLIRLDEANAKRELLRQAAMLTAERTSDVRSELDGLNGTALLIAERAMESQDAIVGGLIDVENEVETTRTQVLLQLVGMLGDMDIMHDQAQGQRSVTIDRLTDLRTQLGGTLHVDLSTLAQRLDLLHADLVALLPVAPLVPVAGVASITALGGAGIQLVPAGGHAERVVFSNTAGAMLEFEVRMGGVRIDYMRLAANARDTVGPIKITGPVTLVGIAGTIANFALLRWSVVYR